MARSSYCILFNLLKNPALLSQLLQFSLGRSPYCIPFNLLKNPALLFQFLYCQIFQIALTSILLKNPALLFQFLYGQIFHIAFNFNLLKNSALFQFLYGQIFILHALSICSRTFAIASNFLWADLPIASSSICSRILHCFKV